MMDGNHCKNPDRCKATIQMDVLDRVCFGGGLSLDRAIRELQLDNLKYARIAKREGFDRVAKEIRNVVKEK